MEEVAKDVGYNSNVEKDQNRPQTVEEYKVHGR
jgi:hypothetical protein